LSRRILIIANPKAGLRWREGLPEACRERLRAAGHRAEIAWARGPQDSLRLAREASAHFEVVASLGGDGTAGQVADGLVGGEAALGIIPAGTRNVVARELGIPRSPLRAAAALGEYPFRRASLGWAARRHFILCLSAGIDVEVLSEAERLSPGHLSLGVHGRAIWRTLRRRRWPRLLAHLPGGSVEGSLAIVSNAKTYAAFFRAAPRGGLDAPHLHVTVHRGRTRISLLRSMIAMLRGRHTELPDVVTEACQTLRLEPVEGRVSYERDGDVEGCLPLELRAVPEAVWLAAPETGPGA
jgi:diacylglycerol kinase family enzyme